MVIKAVFFDFYGTLGHFFPPREEIQTEAISSFGFSPTRRGLVEGYASADAFMAEVNASDWPMSQRHGDDRLQFFAEYERLILRGADINADLELASRIWQKVQEIPYGLALFDDCTPVLDMIRQQHNVSIGMISNIGRSGKELTEDMGLTPYLDFTVTSQEVGSNKPHPPIFLAALECAGVEPNEAIHVGDSYLSDVQGARGVGINPVLLDREGVIIEEDCVKIGGLVEVLELLATWCH